MNLGEHLALHRASTAQKRTLARCGFTVHEVELSEFLKTGDSAKCLTLRLDTPALPARGPPQAA